MKNHIRVLSRQTFKLLIKGLNAEQLANYAFISIHEPIGHTGKEMFGGGSETILDSAPNVLNLWFDDAEEQIPIIGQPDQKLILFDENMAQTVFNFVKENENAEFWVLHCTAGVNRSGAIGGFLADYFGINYLEFKRSNPQVVGNSLVSKLLTRKLQEYLEQ